MKATIIDVFATLFLLSYSKLLSASLLRDRDTHNADGDFVSGTSNILWVDATVRYLSDEHLPFAITTILILLFILLPPFLQNI